jgi:chaperonin GroES
MSNKKHFFVGDGVPNEPPAAIVDANGNVAESTYVPGVDVRVAAAKTDPNWDMEKKVWKILPETRMSPYEDRLIILPDPAMEKSAGGIIVAEAYQDKHVPSRGTVIAVGPGKDIGGSSIMAKIYKLLCTVFQKEEDLYAGMAQKRGDRVMYGHYAGIPIEDPDDEKKTYLIMRPHDVFIKI